MAEKQNFSLFPFLLKKKKTNSVWNSDAADALHFQIVGILHVVQKALYFYLF